MGIIRLLVITAVLIAAQSIAAATIDDYQRRVDSARSGLKVLLDNISQEEIGKTPNEPSSEVIAEVRSLIPASEKIQTASGDIETENKWFTDGLAAAEKENDLAKRAVILTELDKRVSALYQNLEELQIAAAVERSKDEDKRKLAEILNRPEYQKPPQKEESASGEWIRRILEWIESWFPKFNPSPNAMSGFGSLMNVLQWVVVIAILGLIGFLVYKLAPLFAPRFRRRSVKDKRTERVILGERIGEDQSANDLFSEAERLAREGDVRGAIRKGYVALLCELSDRKLIGLARHKTNRDYLRDVRSRREIYTQMNGITGTFERHWYGSEIAQANDWAEFRRQCGETIKTI